MPPSRQGSGASVVALRPVIFDRVGEVVAVQTGGDNPRHCTNTELAGGALRFCHTASVVVIRTRLRCCRSSASALRSAAFPLKTFSERRGRLETDAAWWRREGPGKWEGQLETASAF